MGFRKGIKRHPNLNEKEGKIIYKKKKKMYKKKKRAKLEEKNLPEEKEGEVDSFKWCLVSRIGVLLT